MRSQISPTHIMAAAVCASLGACADTVISGAPVRNEGPASCEPRLLGGYAVPTEKIAKAIYLAIFQGREDRENPQRNEDVEKSLKENGWRVVAVSDGGSWEVFIEHDALMGLAGGGFAATMDKCSGRILYAGYIR